MTLCERRQVTLFGVWKPIYVEPPSKSNHLGVHNLQRKCAICLICASADCTLSQQIVHTQVIAFAWWLQNICLFLMSTNQIAIAFLNEFTDSAWMEHNAHIRNQEIFQFISFFLIKRSNVSYKTNIKFQGKMKLCF